MDNRAKLSEEDKLRFDSILEKLKEHVYSGSYVPWAVAGDMLAVAQVHGDIQSLTYYDTLLVTDINPNYIERVVKTARRMKSPPKSLSEAQVLAHEAVVNLQKDKTELKLSEENEAVLRHLAIRRADQIDQIITLARLGHDSRSIKSILKGNGSNAAAVIEGAL